MFGDEILVSPIVTASEFTNGTALKNIWLPEGKWLEAETGTILEGNQKYLRSFAQSEIPFFIKKVQLFLCFLMSNILKKDLIP